MKKFLLSIPVLFALTCSAQENPSLKRDNFFVSAELSKPLGYTDSYKKYGLSFVYNRLLPKTNFGVGAGLEFIDIRTKKLGGIMPGVDLRYYAKFGKSTLIPLAQIGYNFYKYQYQKPGSSVNYEYKEGLGYTLGIGYSYNLTQKGSGLFGAFKLKGLQYKYTDPLMPKAGTGERLSLSVGWRF